MSETDPLANEIKKLRRCFHLRLSYKRGLLVREVDLPEAKLHHKDDAVQSRLEKLSLWRQLVSFIKRKERT